MTKPLSFTYKRVPIELRPSDNELIQRALGMYSNWVQTGDVICSVEDLKNQGREKEINHLTLEQMKLVVRLEELKTIKDWA